MSVVVPNVDCEHCVVRMRYLSNNPTENDRGMIFYQCSDVSVTKQETVAAEASEQNSLSVKVAGSEDKHHIADSNDDGVDHSCCAPALFSIEGYETGSWRNPTQKKFFFDSEQQFLRVDTDSGDGVTTKDGSFQMYNNFTSGIEFYYNTVTDTCDLYGLNYWSDWCYGASNSQSHATTITMGTQISDVWNMQTESVQSPFTWTNQRESCVPMGMNREDTGETTVFYNFKVGQFCPRHYEMPQACYDALEAKALAAPAGDVRASLLASPRIEQHLAHFAPTTKQV